LASGPLPFSVSIGVGPAGAILAGSTGGALLWDPLFKLPGLGNRELLVLLIPPADALPLRLGLFLPTLVAVHDPGTLLRKHLLESFIIGPDPRPFASGKGPEGLNLLHEPLLLLLAQTLPDPEALPVDLLLGIREVQPAL
jgi:hypothetical protein